MSQLTNGIPCKEDALVAPYRAAAGTWVHAPMWTSFYAASAKFSRRCVLQGADYSSAINTPWPSILLYDPAGFRGDVMVCSTTRSFCK
jgi:hypothetical protein